MKVPRFATLLALGAALLGAAPGAAQATEFGLSDQQPGTFADARVRGLGLQHARLIVAWNAATTEVAYVQSWLDAVADAGLTPHVVFGRQRTDDCPGSPCVVPTRAQYRAAVEAFHTRWPQVTTFTTWNEANHYTQPVADRPEAVAGYWSELTAACPGCTIVAGDVLDSGAYVRWLERFKAAAPTMPRRWGLHNYGDVSYGITTGTDAVLAAVPGELWIEETGGIVTLRDERGRVTFSTSETRAAASIDRAFELVKLRPRIARMYLYHWRAHTLTDTFDAGLVRPDGTARNSLARVQANLAAFGPGAAARVVAAPSPQATVSARWSTVKRNQLLVRVRCGAPTGVCKGRIAVAAETKRTGSARMRTTVLARRRAYATTAARKTVTVRVTVTKAARARIRAAKTRRLAVTLTATRPVAATADSALKLARPAKP